MASNLPIGVGAIGGGFGGLVSASTISITGKIDASSSLQTSLYITLSGTIRSSSAESANVADAASLTGAALGKTSAYANMAVAISLNGVISAASQGQLHIITASALGGVASGSSAMSGSMTGAVVLLGGVASSIVNIAGVLQPSTISIGTEGKKLFFLIMTDTYLTSDTTTLWLNTNYVYRRQFEVIGPAIDGYPVLPVIDIRTLVSKGKVRYDFEDILLSYLNTDNSWSTLGCTVKDGQLEFALQNLLQPFEADARYYLYYGNPSLINRLTTSPYSQNFWPHRVNLSSSEVTQTRPGFDWVNSIALSPQAKATFNFTGDRVQVISNTGNFGQMLIQIDNADPTAIDLYSSPPKTNVIVYTITGLADGAHILRIRPTGKRSPQSSSNAINVQAFQSRPDIIVNDLGEQSDLLPWGNA